MKGKFLSSLLATFEFPSALCPGLVATYADRYTPALVANRCFGDLVVPLVWSANPSDIDGAVIKSGNPAALSALLEHRDLNSSAIISTATRWHLSVDDQWRLILREMPSGTVKVLLSIPYLTSEVHSHLGDRIMQRQPKAECPPAPGVSSLYEPNKRVGVSGSLKVGPKWHEARLRTNVSRMGANRFGPYPLDDELNPVLGNAEDADSVLAWRTFCNLVESDPDVSLGSILDVTRCLAYGAN